MEKVAVFLDYANLEHGSQDAGCHIDYEALLNYLASPAEGRFLTSAMAYVPIDPRREHARDRAMDELWGAGFQVKSKVGTIAGQSYKCDYDVEITMDMEKILFENKPDIVVLISGDSDFIPVVLDLRSKGVRVEVASFENSISGLLTRRCSGFINLDMLTNPTPNQSNVEPQSESNDDDGYMELNNRELVPTRDDENSEWTSDGDSGSELIVDNPIETSNLNVTSRIPSAYEEL